MTTLQTLDLTNPQVADLEPLKGLPALQSLDLSGTQVANLEPLNGLTALQTLIVARQSGWESGGNQDGFEAVAAWVSSCVDII